MPNSSVYADIAARCGGHARIGVVCAGGAAIAARLNEIFSEMYEEGSPVEFCEGCDDCSAAIAVGEEGIASLKKANLPYVVADELSPSSVGEVMRGLLFAFPVQAIDVCMPDWVRALPAENSAVAELCGRLRETAAGIYTLRDCDALSEMLAESVSWMPEADLTVDPACGRATLRVAIKEGAFFRMLSETAGEEITDQSSLMSYIVGAADARSNYAKIKDALECARVTGYGIVRPSDDDLSLEKPVVVRQGGSVGIKLRATAPSYHIVKVDICGEVSPIMGAAAQSEAMVGEIMSGFENDPQSMWNTNLFGKSLRGMVQEGLSGKVNGMQEETRVKMRKAITRIVNEGKGGVICILL